MKTIDTIARGTLPVTINRPIAILGDLLITREGNIEIWLRKYDHKLVAYINE